MMRKVGVRAHDVRHHRSIDHPQSFDAACSTELMDHRRLLGVRSHLSRSHRMTDGGAIVADEIHNTWLRVHHRTIEKLPASAEDRRYQWMVDQICTVGRPTPVMVAKRIRSM